ncbi:MAG: hypothetical protein FWD49_08025 [Firmicutes bacterium]|nr:hypothetical protein [Bacillota bacterium]
MKLKAPLFLIFAFLVAVATIFALPVGVSSASYEYIPRWDYVPHPVLPRFVNEQEGIMFYIDCHIQTVELVAKYDDIFANELKTVKIPLEFDIKTGRKHGEFVVRYNGFYEFIATLEVDGESFTESNSVYVGSGGSDINRSIDYAPPKHIESSEYPRPFIEAGQLTKMTLLIDDRHSKGGEPQCSTSGIREAVVFLAPFDFNYDIAFEGLPTLTADIIAGLEGIITREQAIRKDISSIAFPLSTYLFQFDLFKQGNAFLSGRYHLFVRDNVGNFDIIELFKYDGAPDLVVDLGGVPFNISGQISEVQSVYLGTQKAEYNKDLIDNLQNALDKLLYYFWGNEEKAVIQNFYDKDFFPALQKVVNAQRVHKDKPLIKNAELFPYQVEVLGLNSVPCKKGETIQLEIGIVIYTKEVGIFNQIANAGEVKSASRIVVMEIALTNNGEPIAHAGGLGLRVQIPKNFKYPSVIRQISGDSGTFYQKISYQSGEEWVIFTAENGTYYLVITEETDNKKDYMVWIYVGIGIAGGGVVVCAVLIIIKKKTKKTEEEI